MTKVWEQARWEEAQKAYREATEAGFVPEKVQREVDELLTKYVDYCSRDRHGWSGHMDSVNADLTYGAVGWHVYKWAAKWWKHNKWDNTWNWY